MPTEQKAFVACVPHVPLLSIQGKQQNVGFWDAYVASVAAFDAFDPEVVVVFGGDHYSHIHLKLAPTFLIGHKAVATEDCGGVAGDLDVPTELSVSLAKALVDDGFDMATSYAMNVDHGFSNVLGEFLHDALDSRPVIPVHINSLSDPRPTFKRCRQLGEAIGRWAKSTGKRVAFLASGGLSHQTNFIFPQYDTAPDERVRTFIVHGGTVGGITSESWVADIEKGMGELSGQLTSGEFKAPWINREWDEAFLAAFATRDLTALDAWTDEDVLEKAGYGGGEVRQWVAAAAAGLAAGAPTLSVAYYSDETTLAVGAAVALTDL